jgi:hypothetical protein
MAAASRLLTSFLQICFRNAAFPLFDEVKSARRISVAYLRTSAAGVAEATKSEDLANQMICCIGND